jgi:hypothetical protein
MRACRVNAPKVVQLLTHADKKEAYKCMCCTGAPIHSSKGALAQQLACSSKIRATAAAAAGTLRHTQHTTAVVSSITPSPFLLFFSFASKVQCCRVSVALACFTLTPPPPRRAFVFSGALAAALAAAIEACPRCACGSFLLCPVCLYLD